MECYDPRKEDSYRIVSLIHDQVMGLPSIFNGLEQVITHLLSSSSGHEDSVGSALAKTILADGIKYGGKKLLQPYFNQPNKLEEILEEIRQLGIIKDYSGGYEQFKQEVHQVCEGMVQEAKSYCQEHPDSVTLEGRHCMELLQSEDFQNLLSEWIAGVKPSERESIKASLIQKMEKAMTGYGLNTEQLSQVSGQFFDTLDREIKSHQDWERWRDTLQRDYLILLNEGIDRKTEEILKSQESHKTSKLEKLLERYQQKLLETCKNISSPISMSLEDFYVSLPLVVKRESSYTCFIEDLLQEESCLVFLGNSGTGKSTLLNWLAYTNLIQQEGFSDGIVLVHCRGIDRNVQEGSIEEILESEFKSSFSNTEAKMLAAYFRSKLETEKLLLLIDGLDELKNDQETRRKFFEHIIELSKEFPYSKIILSSRPTAYHEIFSYSRSDLFLHVKEVELQGFTLQNKKILIKDWVKYTYAEHSVKQQKKYIQSLYCLLQENPEMDRMTDTPLLFSFLLLNFQEKGTAIPVIQAELYEDAISYLLKWKAHPDLHKEEIRLQLEYLALEMSRKEVIQLPEIEVIRLLRQFRKQLDKDDNPLIEYVKKHENISEFLSLLGMYSGLMVVHGEGSHIWEFKHLVFQEYLAACAIINGLYLHNGTFKKLPDFIKIELVGENFYNGKLKNSQLWRDIVDFILESRKNENEIIELLKIFISETKCGYHKFNLYLIEKIIDGLYYADGMYNDIYKYLVEKFIVPHIKGQLDACLITKKHFNILSHIQDDEHKFEEYENRNKLRIEFIEEPLDVFEDLFKKHIYNIFFIFFNLKNKNNEKIIEQTFALFYSEYVLDVICACSILDNFADVIIWNDYMIDNLHLMKKRFVNNELSYIFDMKRKDSIFYELMLLIVILIKSNNNILWNKIVSIIDWDGVIKKLFHSNDPYIRKISIWIFSEYPYIFSINKFTELFFERFHDNDDDIKKAALQKIVSLPIGKDSIKYFIELLKDENDEIRAEATWALQNFKNNTSIKWLIKMLDDKCIRVRKYALISLDKLDAIKNIIPKVIKLIVGDSDTCIRCISIKILNKYGNKKTVSYFVEQIYHSDTKTSSYASRVLLELNTQEVAQQLFERIFGKGDLCSIALETLGKLDVAIPLVVKILFDDRHKFDVALMVLKYSNLEYSICLIIDKLFEDADNFDIAVTALRNLDIKKSIFKIINDLFSCYYDDIDQVLNLLSSLSVEETVYRLIGKLMDSITNLDSVRVILKKLDISHITLSQSCSGISTEYNLEENIADLIGFSNHNNIYMHNIIVKSLMRFDRKNLIYLQKIILYYFRSFDVENKIDDKIQKINDIHWLIISIEECDNIKLKKFIKKIINKNRFEKEFLFKDIIDKNEDFWVIVMYHIAHKCPSKIINSYQFLVQDFLPTEEWCDLKSIQNTSRYDIRKRRVEKLKKMMHSTTWEDREMAADVLNTILLAIFSEGDETFVKENSRGGERRWHEVLAGRGFL